MSSWVAEALRKIDADRQRSADTHLFKLTLPGLKHVDIYLKDESTHPTGSLKHRLARSLFLYALCNGKLNEQTTIVEASSGSTAVSEAYFARMIGLPFIAVMPRSTALPWIWLPKPAAISWTSSCMPSARPTGVETTTLPKASLSK